jgi:toxin YoeB
MRNPCAQLVRLVFTLHGCDYCFWQSQGGAMLGRLNRVLNEAMRDPFEGIDRPAPSHDVLAGCWSRRIDEDHQLVYLVDGGDIVELRDWCHHETSTYSRLIVVQLSTFGGGDGNSLSRLMCLFRRVRRFDYALS